MWYLNLFYTMWYSTNYLYDILYNSASHVRWAAKASNPGLAVPVVHDALAMRDARAVGELTRLRGALAGCGQCHLRVFSHQWQKLCAVRRVLRCG
ncbi:hypothetical protein CDAR_261841 [Caerostris darwini]|uniref:Uncharacterized protein n=1 Tax=Caerostris darwini TaxID=1538125 RepID=A0AAV4V168_9ARAC|nr:hypothetical protein CDAR_261841 [Caerostris darwini]